MGNARLTRCWIVIVAIVTMLMACNWSAAIGQGALATSVASTLAASGAGLGGPSGPGPGGAVATPTVIQSAADGGASGKVCFPEASTTAITAYFQRVPDGSLVTLRLPADQSSYVTDLPQGKYILYAWTDGFARGGSYSQAVACGLGPGCTDHTPREFEVAPGALTQTIDLCDWPEQAGAVPLPPGVTAGSTPPPAEGSAGTTATPLPPGTETGAIEGSVKFPDAVIPRLVIIAYQLNTDYWWYIVTGDNWSTYEIADIPPGEYQVIGYAPDGREAAYSSGTSPATVTVQSGLTTSGIDLTIWRPAGTYRAKPAGVQAP